MAKRNDEDSDLPRAPRPKPKGGGANKVILIVLGSAAAVTLLGCAGLCVASQVWWANVPEERKQQIREEEAKRNAPVSAPALLKAYAENPVRAEQEYGNRTVRVKGKVTSITTTAIHLETFPAVICWTDRKDDIAKVSNGQTVVMEGRITLGNAGGIYLHDARLTGE